MNTFLCVNRFAFYSPAGGHGGVSVCVRAHARVVEGVSLLLPSGSATCLGWTSRGLKRLLRQAPPEFLLGAGSGAGRRLPRAAADRWRCFGAFLDAGPVAAKRICDSNVGRCSLTDCVEFWDGRESS